MRTVTMDILPQDVITKDNVSIKVNAVVYFRIVDAERAIVQVADYYYAVSQLAQTTLRSILGQFTMDEMLSNRESVNAKLQALLDQDTEAWGVKIAAVELKHIDLPKEMQRAMAQEAEAERERRAKVISADGEVQKDLQGRDGRRQRAEGSSGRSEDRGRQGGERCRIRCEPGICRAQQEPASVGALDWQPVGCR